MNSAPASTPVAANAPWWRLLNNYHWFVLIVAALGWLFDCLDQQLFNLARIPAMRELLPPGKNVNEYGGYATSIFLVGWATGGLIFGVLGDRIGRAKTMMWTILIYSLCTGLSAFSIGFWDFAVYRFITGLGVGGEFAVGISLVAEVMPERARPYALGLLQSLSTVGNVSAALISMGLGHLEQSGAIGGAWRWMFIIGALPAFLALIVRSKLKEPERWQELKRNVPNSQLGSYGELFGNDKWQAPAALAGTCVAALGVFAFLVPAGTGKNWGVIGLVIAAFSFGARAIFGGKGSPWRRNAVVGLVLACAGVIGLWGIGFFSIDLIRSVLTKQFTAEGLTGGALAGKVTFWAGVTSMMLNFGAFFGIYGFGLLSQRIGRRPTFAISFTLALIATVWVFLNLKTQQQIFWMIPILGVCQLSVFGGYAIYFPELFPTHLRSTGTSFCYNVGRFIAASGPALLGLLTSKVFHDSAEPLRYAGATMACVFLLGLIALPFAPETKGKPLPEDQRGLAH